MSLLVLSYIRKSRLPGLDKVRLASAQGGQSKNTNRWLLTYIDLFTALLGFFIFMIVQVGLEQSTPKRNYQKIVQDLYSHSVLYKQQHNLDWLEIENTLSKGVRLTLKTDLINNESLFASAKAQINPSYLPYLRKVTDLLLAMKLHQFGYRYASLIQGIESEGYKVKFFIRVEGHTDSQPLAKGAFFRDNVELSTFRAYAVQDLIRLHTGLAKKHFSLAGYGSFHSVVEDSAAAQNRRVEIYLLPQVLSTAKVISSKENNFLSSAQENRDKGGS